MTGNEENVKMKRGRSGPKIDVFELLYIAISIATFSHTVWAASFAFEGMPPADGTWDMILWQLKGSLIAVAIDLGMLLSARVIARSRTTNWSMIVAFLVAAISSFYTQLLYILYHTGDFKIGSGVGQYWTDALVPLVDAKVLILPLLLPFLGIIYTIARVGQEKKAHNEAEERRKSAPVTVEQVLKQTQPIALQNSGVEQLTSGDEFLVEDDRIKQAIAALGDAQVNLDELRYWDPAHKAWRGPFESKDAMIKNMITLGRRRNTMLKNRANRGSKSNNL